MGAQHDLLARSAGRTALLPGTPGQHVLAGGAQVLHGGQGQGHRPPGERGEQGMLLHLAHAHHRNPDVGRQVGCEGGGLARVDGIHAGGDHSFGPTGRRGHGQRGDVLGDGHHAHQDMSGQVLRQVGRGAGGSHGQGPTHGGVLDGASSRAHSPGDPGVQGGAVELADPAVRNGELLEFHVVPVGVQHAGEVVGCGLLLRRAAVALTDPLGQVGQVLDRVLGTQLTDDLAVPGGQLRSADRTGTGSVIGPAGPGDGAEGTDPSEGEQGAAGELRRGLGA